MHPTRRSVASIAGLLLFVFACQPAGDEGPDTTEAADSGALDGLTREQIRAQARPMTPEDAEALGIVDTTIHLEDPTVDLDTIIPPEIRPTDTLSTR